MEPSADILIGIGVSVGICWLAIFIVALSSHKRGLTPKLFSGSGHSTHGKALPPMTWWQFLIWLPIACVWLPIFGVCCLVFLPPIYVLEKWIFKP
jgi:hypothetical protein